MPLPMPPTDPNDPNQQGQPGQPPAPQNRLTPPGGLQGRPPLPGRLPPARPGMRPPGGRPPIPQGAKPVVRLLLVEMTNKPLRFLRRYKARVRANRPVSLLHLSGAVR